MHRLHVLTKNETVVKRPANASRKHLILAIVGVIVAFLFHPLVGGVVTGLVAWLDKSLSRRTRVVFAWLAPLFAVYGVFFSLVPSWMR